VTRVLPDWPRAELIAEALHGMRHATVPLPDLQLVERPGWLQLVTPSFKTGGFNEVAHAALPATEADAIIDQTIAQYRALGCRFRWTVAPDSAPPDLDDRLARRGLARTETLLLARGPSEAGATNGVERITPSTADAFTQVMAEGWASDPVPLARAYALMLEPGSRHRLYLARVNGEPAAAAGAVFFARSAYLLGGVVLPRFRARGLYRALVAARLADARAAGLELVTSNAIADTSAPILERMGFERLCALTVFRG
jgi:hypothetical protein